MAIHSDLARKLKLLYELRLNSEISSHTDLAKHLSISKQAVSRWIHGCETRRGDRIPGAQLNRISNLFRIPEYWLALPYVGFEDVLFKKLEDQEGPTVPRPERISISQLPTTSSVVFGRESELEILKTAWRQKTANVVQIVAFGGVGKSCLTNYWLAYLNEHNYLGAKQIYAWSFYWQGASSDIKSSGDFFIEHALEWFGDTDSSKGTPWAKANRLAKLIRESRTLLILDGLEPLQCSPGPNIGAVENPAVSFLIKELACENNGLCIITSRLPVLELVAYPDNRTISIQLDNLSVEKSVELLKGTGVNGNEIAIAEAVSKYSCHALSLTLLAGYLNIVYQGDIRQARMLNSLFDEESRSEQAKNIMKPYFDWFQDMPEQTILALIGLIDRTTSLGELKEICSKDFAEGIAAELSSLTHAQWSYTIKRLCDARLIAVHEVGNKRIIECHPLVKEYAVMQLKANNFKKWVDGNNLLFNYYQMNVPEYPGDRGDLDNLFRAVLHGTRGGLFREAFHLYFFRIKNGYTMLSRGSHYTDQHCISAFFSHSWTTPVIELSDLEKIHLFASLSANQMSLGNISEAILHAEKCLSWFISEEKWLEASSFAGPYISMLIAVGRLHDADKVMEDLDPCVENTDNSILRAMGLVFHAYVEYLKGEKRSAGNMFNLAEEELIKSEPSSPVSFPTVSSYYCKFLLETGRHQEALERLVKTFAWRKRKSWQVAIDTTSLFASDLLVLGLTFLARGDLINGKKYLDQQVELFRSADEWLYLPTGLHSRARYFIKVKDFQAATTDLNEALQIAQRTGAVFGEWETYLNFSQLYRAKNDAAQCDVYLRKAVRMPNMDMYKFRNEEMAELEKYIISAKGKKPKKSNIPLSPRTSDPSE